MAKFTVSTYKIDAIAFASSIAEANITLLAAGTIAVAGVTKVTGSSAADIVNLNLPAGYTTGFTPAAIATFNFDTFSSSMSNQDALFGTSAADTIVITNTGTAAAANLKYTSGGTTNSDGLTLTTGGDRLTLATAFKGTITSSTGTDTVIGSSAVDTITMGTSASTWVYSASGTAVDVITGSTGADKITLGVASKISYASGGGADSIYGSSGTDTITVSSAAVAVTVKGGGGADIITLTITASIADTIEYTSKTDATAVLKDSITNFQPNALATHTDILKFTALQVGTFALVATGGAFTGATGGLNSEARATDLGADTLIEIDVNGDSAVDMAITLIGVSDSTLIGADDFAWS